MKYIKPELKIENIEISNSIASNLTDWLENNVYTKDTSITTYYVESV